ncbi:hypothetical protein EV193_108239 [Herbihabitans rhizosphaerae]|uniref:Uncharacterized protein n=1 Tax=Herbihabitans rhizosphaerae TaxID=1872711 RepID=A0A4Q7KI86_9PSEU|nr:hypothetical protein [Herbihabitans rhizosphaerae]RZS34889.1 hypothetical protein EV193_108239 [Herbihabitans rhizosphaerae]
MNESDVDGAKLLAPLRGTTPDGESAVSVEKAIATGKRRRAVRGALGAAAVAVVTVLAVILVPAALNTNRDEQVRVATAPTEFNVLRQEFTVGSAGGFTPYAYRTGRFAQRIDLKRAGTPDPTEPTAMVTIYPSGPYSSEPDGEPAPAVNDRRAKYVPSAGPRSTRIAWEWADGAWAYAEVPPGPDAQAIAHRVAQSVGRGGTAPARVPFTIGALGEDRVLGVVNSMPASNHGPTAQLLIGRTDPSGASGEMVGIVVGLTTASGQQNTSLDGRPAIESPGRVTMLDGGPGRAATASALISAEPLRLKEIAASVQISGDPANPSTWPVNPVR